MLKCQKCAPSRLITWRNQFWQSWRKVPENDAGVSEVYHITSGVTNSGRVGGSCLKAMPECRNCAPSLVARGVTSSGKSWEEGAGKRGSVNRSHIPRCQRWYRKAMPECRKCAPTVITRCNQFWQSWEEGAGKRGSVNRSHTLRCQRWCRKAMPECRKCVPSLVT